MKFLSQEEIEKLQIEEAHSDKKPKKTAEQIQAIYSSGQNILVSASAGSGKTFVMAERIIDQLARGIEIRQLFISTFTVKAATELKERLEKKISQQIQETQDLELKKHLGRQLADLPNAAIGTMDSFTQKFLTKHGYLLDLAPNFRILQNESEQLLLKNEVFRQVFEKHYQSKEQEQFSKLVKNFAGKSKDARGLRKQVYMIYEFLQSTSNPQVWLEESFLRGFENADFTIAKEKLADDIKEKLWDLENFFRLPEQFRGLENTLREKLRQSLTRGKIECSLRIETKKQTNAELNLNKELANQVIQSLQWIKAQAGEGEINLTDVLRYPGVVEAQEQDLDAISQDLLTAFDDLLTDFTMAT